MDNTRSSLPHIESMEPVSSGQTSFFTPQVLLILILVGILAMGAGVGLLTVKQPSPSSQVNKGDTIHSLMLSLTPEPTNPPVTLTSKYDNPFSEDTQYDNPFGESSNPFDNLE